LKRQASRIRHWAVRFTFVVAILATFATSSVPPTIEDSHEGEPILLNAENPEAYVDFSFDVSDETARSATRADFKIDYTFVWSSQDVPEPHVGVGVAATDGSAPAERFWVEQYGSSCVGDLACTGDYRVRFVLPVRLRSYEVRIDWSVDASAEFETRDEIPEREGIFLDVGDVVNPGDPHTRLFGDQIDTYESPVRVSITANEPLPAGLGLEIGDVPENSEGPFVSTWIVDDAGAKGISGNAAYELNIPGSCLVGPCSFEIVIGADGVEYTAGDGSTQIRSGGFIWHLTSPEAVDVEVEIVQESENE
jgi:hypothetical protein